jgi:acetoin utilization deacetylase AcuC-like enzyme
VINVETVFKPASGHSNTKSIPPMKQDQITVFYDTRMCPNELGASSESKSPLKATLLLEFLQRQGLMHHVQLAAPFEGFANAEFYLAHEIEYVEGFFAGTPPHSTGHGLLGIEWSPDYAQSTRFTNASLYHAIAASIRAPERICLSPTSGFHHAVPKHGALFCAFSGQVIAAVKLHRELGVSGAFVDLDGHFGNSIEDSRSYVLELDVAIPKGCNINIRTKHAEYLEELHIRLGLLHQLFAAGRLHYLVLCHGADSHEDDDIGHQLTTAEWLECAAIFCEHVKRIELLLGRPVPVALSLFGGYRADYDTVLALHAGSLMQVLASLANVPNPYVPIVGPNPHKLRR